MIEHADLVKDVHEQCQFTIVKLASCTSPLDLLEGCNAEFLHTEVAQTLANLEALEKRVGVVEDVLVHAGLREVRADIQKMNEEISTIRGNWEAATIKLQGVGFRGGKGPSSAASNKSGVDYKDDG